MEGKQVDLAARLEKQIVREEIREQRGNSPGCRSAGPSRKGGCQEQRSERKALSEPVIERPPWHQGHSNAAGHNRSPEEKAGDRRARGGVFRKRHVRR